jgi:hypothetical protein
MKAALALAALLAGTIGAQAMSDSYVAAFVRASQEPGAKVQATIAELQKYRPLEELAKAGVLKSPYDCLPEHRVLCHDVIAGDREAVAQSAFSEAGVTVLQVWGEWFDAYAAPGERANYIAAQVDGAADRGFNLLTNEELAAVKD